jgi:uncharacterized membrane protein
MGEGASAVEAVSALWRCGLRAATLLHVRGENRPSIDGFAVDEPTEQPPSDRVVSGRSIRTTTRGAEEADRVMRSSRRVPFSLLLALVPTASAADGTFVGVGIPPGHSSSVAYGVSGDGGVVVGYSFDSDSGDAFRWDALHGMDTLIAADGEEYFAGASASYDGSVIAVNRLIGSSHTAYRWTESAGLQGIGFLPGDSVSGTSGVSGDGTVLVGSSGEREAFSWTLQTAMLGLGRLPGSDSSVARAASYDGSVIVGESRFSGTAEREAFSWTPQAGMLGLGDLPGGSFSSFAVDVTPDGAFIVGTSSSDRGIEAFRYHESEGMIGLGDLPGGGFTSVARAVSADGGTVVGYAYAGTSVSEYSRAFVWTEERGMRELATVFEQDYGGDTSGWTLIAATGISDDGSVIVGEGRNPAGETEGWVMTLPEPHGAATWLATTSTLSVLARRRLRDRRRELGSGKLSPC